MAISSSTQSESSPLQAITFAVGTDVGRRREENQDSFGVFEKDSFKFFVVADGMGGAKGGAIASNLAIRVIERAIEEDPTFRIERISTAVRNANSEIFEKGSADESMAGMGTTFVGLAFHETKMYVINVGDSRAYRVRGNSIKQLTKDHTLIRELLDSGAITPDQAENHPVAHMLTRSLGPTPEVEVDCLLSDDGPARGDLYLLCSDGLYNLVHTHEIAMIVKEYSVDEAVEHLINLANERGGTDNITVLVVEIGENYPVDPAQFPEEGEEIVKQRKAPLTESITSAAAQQNEYVEKETHTNGGTAVNGSTFHQPNPDFGRSSQVMSHTTTQAPPVEQNVNTVAEPQARSSKNITWVVLGIVLGVLITSYLPGFMRSSGDHKSGDRVLMNPLATMVARSEVDFYGDERATLQPEPLAPQTMLDVEQGDSSTDVSSGIHVAGDKSGLPDVQQKIARIEASLNDLDLKLKAFSGPLTGELSERLAKAESERNTRRDEELKLGLEHEQATRKFSVWFGRKQRLQKTEPIEMAAEIAVSSESVKDKKELFERATWTYLKEVEVWQYNPNDEELTQNVSRLGRIREQRHRELTAEIRKAVDENIALSEKEIADLTAKRDATRGRIEALGKEIEFVKIVTGSNPEAKTHAQAALQEDRAHLVSELEELKKLVPVSGTEAQDVSNVNQSQ